MGRAAPRERGPRRESVKRGGNSKLILPNTKRDLEIDDHERERSENSESQAWRREERLGAHDTL